MKQRDIAVLTDALAPVLREFVAAAITPVAERMAFLEGRSERLDQLEKELVRTEKELARSKDDLGEQAARIACIEAVNANLEERLAMRELAGLVPLDEIVGEAVAKAVSQIPPAKDGKSVEPDEVRDMVAAEVAKLPTPKNGTDGASVTALDVAPLLKEMVAEQVSAIPRVVQDGKDGVDGKDGTNVTLDDVAPLIKLAVAEQVAAIPKPRDGIDGKDGTNVTVDDVSAVLDEMFGVKAEQIEGLLKELAAIPVPRDGKDGTSITADDVAPMVEALVTEKFAAMPKPRDGKDGVDGIDGVGVAGGVIDRDGNLVLTLSDGTVLERGGVVGEKGKDGVDGLGFEHLEVIDGELDFTLRFSRGDQVKEFTLAKPTLADMHKGVWRPGPYRRGAVVTWGGSQWLAVRDTEAKPEASDDWKLSVKRGRDGKDGVAIEPKGPTQVKLK